MALLRAISPVWQPRSVPVSASAVLRRHPQHEPKSNFSTSAPRFKKQKGGTGKSDRKVGAIRYFLNHPLTPRPLKFSRLRFLRHWTIHRAWHLYQAKLRTKRNTERYQQYQSMANACELLRNMDNRGFTAEERAKAGLVDAPETSVGYLYRVAMQKSRVWEGIPIEYAKIQTETPSRDGWNHGWTR